MEGEHYVSETNDMFTLQVLLSQTPAVGEPNTRSLFLLERKKNVKRNISITVKKRCCRVELILSGGSRYYIQSPS